MANQAPMVMLRGPGWSMASDDPLIVAVVADLLATGAQSVAAVNPMRRRSQEAGPAVGDPDLCPTPA